MPEIANTDMQELGHGRVFLTGSKTRPDSFYVTIISDDGKPSCTCPGWTYHYKCWHVEEAKVHVLGVGSDEEDEDFQVSL